MTTKNFKKSSQILVLSLALLAVSCSKDDDPGTAAGYLSIINASPSLATYNVYLNNDIMNAAALPLGGTIAYTPIAAGTYDLKFTTASNTESLLTRSITLNDSTTSSYFLIGKSGALDLLKVTDHISSGSLKAAVRFINLSPDAPALDLTINGAAIVINNQFYKQASDFVAIDPGTYNFDIKARATGDVKTTLNGVTMAAGGYYTIFVRGMEIPGDTEHPLAAQLFTNL